MLAAVTGAAYSADSLRQSAREIQHMKKLFNQRQGWDVEEDILPERFFDSEEMARKGSTGGIAGIDRRQFLAARTSYYALRGWDEEGRYHATQETLASMDLV